MYRKQSQQSKIPPSGPQEGRVTEKGLCKGGSLAFYSGVFGESRFSQSPDLPLPCGLAPSETMVSIPL